MNEQEKKISDLYFNPILGLTTSKKLYEYLNKKISMNKFNEILVQVQNASTIYIFF